jgi:hypothetical protein
MTNDERMINDRVDEKVALLVQGVKTWGRVLLAIETEFGPYSKLKAIKLLRMFHPKMELKLAKQICDVLEAAALYDVFERPGGED